MSLPQYPQKVGWKTRLSPHFWAHEWACNDKNHTSLPEEYFWNAFATAWDLEKYRARLNERYSEALGYEISLDINSGYRTPRYNSAVGGVSEKRRAGRVVQMGSRHLYGQAVDISSRGFTGTILMQEALDMRDAGEFQFIKGIGAYDTFIHLDCRLTHAFWDRRTR